MRRKEKEITDQKIIDEILTKSQLCRIALFDDEFPYIVPFNYAYSDNVILFHSATSGKKIDLIRKNNKVCFEIEYSSQIIEHEQSCQWTTRYRSIIGVGVMEIVTEYEEKKKGLDAIMTHYGRTEHTDYGGKSLENLVILKLKILNLTAKQSGNWEKE